MLRQQLQDHIIDSSLEETLHLLAIPGMRESILEGMATEASELSSEPGW